MSEHARFHIKSLEQLRSEFSALGLDLPIETDPTLLGDTVPVGKHTAPNRFAVHPMEGFDADESGAPGELAFRRYRRYAAGGSGLIWFEATAVLREARSNPGQFWLHEGSLETFKRLVAETRKAARDAHGREPVLVLQMTHSGRYSKPDGVPAPLIAHRSPVLDPKHDLPDDYPVVTDEYLDRLQDQFVQAAKLAAEAGFDGVDVKACHRYLMSELLASHTREGKYGGSYENRTRLLRESLGRIRDEVPQVFITTRMNAYDAIDYPYGWGVSKDDYHTPDLSEPLQLAQDLKELGAPLLNVSIGNPYFNPHYGRPYDFPIAGFQAPDDHPLRGIHRFINITGEIQKTIPDVPVIASGYTWLRQFMPYVAAGVIKTGMATLIGQGRGAFAYPDSVKDILEDGKMNPAKVCVTCSACTQIMRDGGMTGCVVRDKEIYGPQYRLGRRFALDRLQKEAERCRECEVPTCQDGCPAHVEIPTFLKAFADGDMKEAYAILHRSNVLPEMCGYVCPSDVQCEDGCVEQVFCENPVPIRDIQLVACRIARLKGIVGLTLPEKATGTSVAVVGGGPAGLAGAIRLLEMGHAVTIIDRSDLLGGTPDQMIPGTRYGNARAEVDAVLKPAIDAGRATLKLGCQFGRDVSLADLSKEHDAVLLALGLQESICLHGGRTGVVDALTFLREVKAGTYGAMPERVAVVGGGNTAADAATTAKRMGARDVYLVYRRSFAEMPAWPEEIHHLLESGVHLLVLSQPVDTIADGTGKATGLKIARTVLGEADASGRRRPEMVPGSESVIDIDLVIEAIGQTLPADLKTALDGVKLSDKGRVEIKNGSFRTSKEHVYAAGDLINGGTTAVQGIREGMDAAEEIHSALL